VPDDCGHDLGILGVGRDDAQILVLFDHQGRDCQACVRQLA
jgi:hypothetical protein